MEQNTIEFLLQSVDLFLRDHHLAPDHVVDDLVLDDVLPAALPELLLGQPLQAQGTLEVVLGHAVARLELADLVVDLGIRDLDLEPDRLLAHDDVVDHAVEDLRGDLGGLLGALFANEFLQTALEVVFFEQNDDHYARCGDGYRSHAQSADFAADFHGGEAARALRASLARGARPRR